jgi:hypothetical protein
MAIKGLEGMSDAQFELELNRGGRFVVFQYTISIILMTFKRASDVHFVKHGESTFGKSLPYTLLTLFLGWWGIPWGPIYSIGCLVTNLGGGKDVTDGILASMREARMGG